MQNFESKITIFIKGEIEAASGPKNTEPSPELYRVIDEEAENNRNHKSRVRREASTGSAYNLRMFGALVMIFSVIAILPIRREVQRLRMFF